MGIAMVGCKTKTDLINDLETGLISYQSFKEDSIDSNTINGNVANVSFKADVTATMKGTTINL